MSMILDRGDYPSGSELMKTVIAADALEQEKQVDEGLYLERDTLLEDDFFETSLDDYDDLLSMGEDDGWVE